MRSTVEKSHWERIYDEKDPHAATLKGFGLDATDVIGGAQAWIAAELPVNPA
jgi:hypothetical protein